MLISDNRREYEHVQQLLRQLDVFPTQVLLEAVIAEVTLNSELKFGLRWFFENGRSRFQDPIVRPRIEGLLGQASSRPPKAAEIGLLSFVSKGTRKKQQAGSATSEQIKSRRKTSTLLSSM
ncbi:hypothetical protein [Rhizobium etli]|uniref:hypothetical protein n=1 Tax=Rhizobium etli TaxID=29449 RepID=UPI0030B81362